jgi:hypothetical protein
MKRSSGYFVGAQILGAIDVSKRKREKVSLGAYSSKESF